MAHRFFEVENGRGPGKFELARAFMAILDREDRAGQEDAKLYVTDFVVSYPDSEDCRWRREKETLLVHIVSIGACQFLSARSGPDTKVIEGFVLMPDNEGEIGDKRCCRIYYNPIARSGCGHIWEGELGTAIVVFTDNSLVSLDDMKWQTIHVRKILEDCGFKYFGPIGTMGYRHEVPPTYRRRLFIHSGEVPTENIFTKKQLETLEQEQIRIGRLF